MARPVPVKIEHKEAGLVGQCLPEALSAWLRNGWTVVDDGSSKKPAVKKQVHKKEQAVEVRPSSEVEES